MKKILLFFLFQSSIYAQTYYDVDYNEIDKSTFDKFLFDKQFYYAENDSLNAFKILNRHERGEVGTLDDVEAFFKELNKRLNLNLDSTKPLIIYYYPGKDPCNSGGKYNIRREYLKSDKELAKKVKAITDVNVLRIYKNKEGIKTLKDHDWRKDPNALIENLFFNFHYSCESFVVINKSKYSAFFGEYSHDEVTENLKEILAKQ